MRIFEWDRLRGESRQWWRGEGGGEECVGALGMCLRESGRGFPIIGARLGDCGKMLLSVVLSFPL